MTGDADSELSIFRNFNVDLYGGGGGIRTPETLSGLTVFKTAGFNHSPTPPLNILLWIRA
jgi:hypothetical protein